MDVVVAKTSAESARRFLTKQAEDTSLGHKSDQLLLPCIFKILVLIPIDLLTLPGGETMPLLKGFEVSQLGVLPCGVRKELTSQCGPFLPNEFSASILIVLQELSPGAGTECSFPRPEAFSRIAFEGFQRLIRFALGQFLGNMRR